MLQQKIITFLQKNFSLIVRLILYGVVRTHTVQAERA